MPDHTSWFTYLLALPNFRALWAMFNHLGCVDANGGQVAMEAGGACPDGSMARELPNHFSYPANTPVTLEYTTIAVFVVLLVAALVLAARGRIARTSEALVPEGSLTPTSFIENFVEIIYGLIAGVIGKKEARYFLPIIGTCAFLIFFSNALGLIPGFAPPTSNFNVTLACGLIIFFATHFYGLKYQGPKYFKHFLGPVWWLSPLMLPLEIVSNCVRPLSLAIRLCVNLFDDHLVVAVFTSLAFVLVPVPVLVLGVLVVALQTYVFCLLSTIYFQLAIEHAEGHGEGHGDAHGHGHGAHA